jgi:glycosyltransferase involved in cell wall biosynthesis
MNPNKPLLSVIIPHLNQPDMLEACLQSLNSQTLDRSKFEIIVVDNGSTSLPQAVIERYPGTLLLQETKAGPGPARNRGAQAACGDILAFTDADCRAHPDWLRSARDAIGREPPRTILGGDVQIWHEPGTDITGVEAYESVFAYRFKLYIEQHGFCGTGNLVVRKSDFEAIGPFRGIEVAEDIEWGGKALKAGYTFRYHPEIIVYHPARSSIRELCVKWDRHIQHAVNAGGASRAWQARWLLRAAAVLVSPALEWTKVITSRRVHGLRPQIKAIAVLIAIRSYRAYRMIFVLLSGRQVQWNRELAASNGRSKTPKAN